MNSIAKIDRILDYIPFVNTVTNATELFYKYLIIPKLNEQQISESPFYTFINEKRTERCWFLLCPLASFSYIFDDCKSQSDYSTSLDRMEDSFGNLDLSGLFLEKVPKELCQLTNLERLNMYYTGLIFLPKEIGLLTNLTDLQLGSNKITSLPKEIGQLTKLTSLNLGENKLDSLPIEFLQLINLTYLNLSNNGFTHFPWTVLKFTNLTTLFLDKLNLKFLPERIEELKSLTHLSAFHNKLSQLPSELGKLTHLTILNLAHNCITSLPETLWHLTNLTHLCLNSNKLTSLSPHIGNLLKLSSLKVSENPHIRELPMSLGQVAGLTDIDNEGTQISKEAIRLILNQCRLMRIAQIHDILGARLEKWKSKSDLSGLSDAQKFEINEWLVRLEKTRDFASIQSELANIVCTILADALKNKEFQELFFTQIEANNSCCQDRAAMALNELYTSWMIMCRKVLPLSLLTGVAKTLCLRKEIAKRLPANEKESVEIYLYYETKLRKELQLVTAITNMAYAQIGSRRWINERSLIADVNRNFFEELYDLPIFQKMIENKWDAEFHQKLEDLGPCPNEGPEDEAILNHQYCQGKIMAEWRQTKMAKAKEWYLQSIDK